VVSTTPDMYRVFENTSTRHGLGPIIRISIRVFALCQSSGVVDRSTVAEARQQASKHVARNDECAPSIAAMTTVAFIEEQR